MTAMIILGIFLALTGFALGALSTYVILAILWPIERLANGRDDAGERRHG